MNKLFLLIFVTIVVALGGYFALNKKGDNVSISNSPEPSQTPATSVIQSAEPLPDVIKATMVTTRGDVELEFYSEVAPKTVANFVKLAKSGFYDGTKFHRVIADFMIQG